MKSFIISLAVLLCMQLASYSQPPKEFMVGGNVAIDYLFRAEIEKKITDAEVYPRIGYLVHPKLYTGLELGFAYSEDNYTNSISRQYLVSAFIRYADTISGNFRYYIDLNGGTWIIPGREEKNFHIGSAVGLMYFIRDFMSIEFKVLSLTYSRGWKKKEAVLYNLIHLEYELLTPNIGICFYF